MRWKNLVIIAFVQIMIRFFLIGNLYNNAGISPAFAIEGFVLLVFSTVFIAAGGYVINDFFDVRIDTINKPERMILTKRIPLKRATTFHMILTTAGILCGLGASYYAGSLKLVGFHGAIAALLWFYSSKYKHSLIIGNLVIAALSATVILVVWLFEFYALKNQAESFSAIVPLFPALNRLVLIYSGFAFLIHLSREIIKDCIDIQGDRAYNCRSIPITIGVQKTKFLLCGIVSITSILLLVFLPDYHSAYSLFSIAYVVIFILIPLLLVIRNLFKEPLRKSFDNSENLLKFAMISGTANLLFLCLL